MKTEVEYGEMFTSMSRFFGSTGPQVIKAVSKRAAKMHKNLQNQKEAEKYPEVKDLAESITFKQDYSKSMWKSYNSEFVERDWTKWWEEKKYFKCDAEEALKVPADKRYIICWPPSNVTGYLHAGHAITAAIEDSLVRWKRMRGFQTLFVPGVDHAGIATQVVVEKKLALKGITRQQLGREKFVEEVHKWKDHSCDIIVDQLTKLGVSPDWEKFVFTMDEDRNRCVTECFVRLKEKGIIYRANRLVNWSCSLKSAISTIEVDEIELPKPKKVAVPGYDKPVEFGVIIDFSYQIKGTDEFITVATTRIETMLGDVAVAVHPEDERYKHLIGKELVHPFIPERKIVVIADSVLVDMEFGSGAVKVTPAHDPNDYECGKRNNLEFINLMNGDGTYNENAGPYAGLKRYEVREKIIKDLDALKLYKGKRPNPMVLKICSRSKDIIEPILKPQWYMHFTEELKEHMLRIADDEAVFNIQPLNFRAIWKDWMNKLQDWCISRQLWWGHRCPAYLVVVEGQARPDTNLTESYVVGRDLEEATVAAEKQFGLTRDKFTLEQDEDVLDTWFSSAMFPFSVTGWPKDTPEFKAFFPNTILETGSDILFFWVARMVIMSYYIMDKQLPFSQVFLHSIVRDESGEKMSKSKGNVIDPLEVINGCSLDQILEKLKTSNLSDKEKKKAATLKKKKFQLGIPQCGSDSLRFGLLSYVKHSKDINLDINVLISLRQFCNKIWNSFKFIMMNLGDGFTHDPSAIKAEELTLIDKWMLTELHNTSKFINEKLEHYHFHEVTSAFQELWVDKFCAIYVEYSKIGLKDPANEARVKNILFQVTETGLRLLHPFMVFISEELYQKLPAWPGKKDSICIADYPLGDDAFTFAESSQFQEVLNVINTSRSVFGGVTLNPKAKPDLYVVIPQGQEALVNVFSQYSELISALAVAGKVGSNFPDPLSSPPFKKELLLQ